MYGTGWEGSTPTLFLFWGPNLKRHLTMIRWDIRWNTDKWERYVCPSRVAVNSGIWADDTAAAANTVETASLAPAARPSKNCDPVDCACALCVHGGELLK